MGYTEYRLKKNKLSISENENITYIYKKKINVELCKQPVSLAMTDSPIDR